MISLLYEPLPECIPAGGRELPVLTDFRAWLQFIGLVGDKALSVADKIEAMQDWLIEPEPVTKEIMDGLLWFCRGFDHRELRSEPDPDAQRRPPTFDWDVDAPCVIADFRRYYQMDLLRMEYLHWWEFRALWESLPEDSATMRRVGIRSLDLSDIKDAKRHAHYARMQRDIALPFVLDDDDIAAAFDF